MLDVNVTVVPAQMLLPLAEMLIKEGIDGVKVIVMTLLVAVVVVKHPPDGVVITQLTTSPFAGV